MARINDLPNNVLRLILYYAAATPANRLSEWKSKLPLVAVCRRWSKLAQNLVFYRVYVELTTSPWSSILPFAYSNTRPFWTSNAELLISRGCILAASCLTIELADRITPKCLRSIALEILRLDRVDWQRINALTITGPSKVHEYSKYIAETEEASDEDIAHTMKYFAQNLRNVVGLNLTYHRLAYPESGSRGDYICRRFSSVYGGQLQIHRVRYSIPLGFVDFSRNIKVLELTLDSTAARVLPSICGETLKVLKLYGVPTNFAWHHFRYDIFDQPIVFHQLTILYLFFRGELKALTEGEVQDKVVSGAHNCDQLSFPALGELAISNCTPNCDLLYADLPFPALEKVKFQGFINGTRHYSRLKLAWVGDFEVTIFPADWSDKTDIYRIANHLFANIRIGRTAYLRILDHKFILDPDLMRWVNLTHLSIQAVDYTAICKAIGRLPNLTELVIRYLEFGDMDIDRFSADSLLFNSVDPMLTWGKKLAMLAICSFYITPSFAVCIGGIQDLILHTDTLKKLFVPESKRQLVAAFIDDYKDRCPHLADIQLLDEWTTHFNK
ncbi:hypothetical protein IW146_001032 [Coemansia sp. RSA 922]|nr:hypothetical protein H4S04_000317 [Coemansia sp. S16]KAJ2068642.1 hypothetical protein GGI08_000770 [Coemansia sp. S2]KAJ2073987.1 hypothetical protein GGH13_001626 [Coemansia sp. S155-1]KAJ2117085.1 hypothetical protein IW146_001032 [Coemansia sp. RSA 922]KAJ2354255.1 hypothetical protein GGH92_000148 [Coemansia sp. RSA 2673]